MVVAFRSMRLIDLAAVILLTAMVFGSSSTVARSAEPTLPVFSKTSAFRHESIPAGVQMLRELGEEHGFDIEHSEDAAMFGDEPLEKYAAVVFLLTTGDVLNDQHQRAFEEYIRNGGAYAGIHAAADTEHDWPWYAGLVGAWFENHPEIQDAIVDVTDRKHPSTDMLPLRWERTDEWYNYDRNPRGFVHVLLTLDETTYEGGE
ncbi:MAG: ThuA domain-containing protein, partial [Woeseiaceae bacterium]